MRNYTMEELVSVLINEPDPDKFIAAAKVFVEKFDEGEYISKADMEAKLEEAHEEGADKGYEEGYAEAKEEDS